MHDLSTLNQPVPGLFVVATGNAKERIDQMDTSLQWFNTEVRRASKTRLKN